MKTLPTGLNSYRRTPVYTNETVPPALLKDHRTKAGIWGLIHVVRGTLRYTIVDAGEDIVLSPAQAGAIEPDVSHHVTLIGDSAFYVEFWR